MRFLLIFWLAFTLNAYGADDFTLKDLDGNILKLSDYRGKWVLVNFWTPGCAPCVEEIPHLNSLSLLHSKRDLVVIGIAMEITSPKVASQAAKNLNIVYPTVYGSKDVEQQIGLSDVYPTSYLYDPNGNKVGFQAGKITQNGIESYLMLHRNKP